MLICDADVWKVGEKKCPDIQMPGLDVISDWMNLDTDIGAPVGVGRILLSKKEVAQRLITSLIVAL